MRCSRDRCKSCYCIYCFRITACIYLCTCVLMCSRNEARVPNTHMCMRESVDHRVQSRVCVRTDTHIRTTKETWTYMSVLDIIMCHITSVHPQYTCAFHILNIPVCFISCEHPQYTCAFHILNMHVRFISLICMCVSYPEYACAFHILNMHVRFISSEHP
jgi:hypothetical protein